jgi:hypothetical protein
MNMSILGRLVALALATALFTLLSLPVIGSVTALILRTAGELGTPGLIAALVVAMLAAGLLAHRLGLWRGPAWGGGVAGVICLTVPVLTIYAPLALYAATYAR